MTFRVSPQPQHGFRPTAASTTAFGLQTQCETYRVHPCCVCKETGGVAYKLICDTALGANVPPAVGVYLRAHSMNFAPQRLQR